MFKNIQRYVTKKNLMVIFAVGILLMLVSSFFKTDDISKRVQNNENICYYDQKNIKRELEHILSRIDGAGKVEVMIVFDNSYEKIGFLKNLTKK